MALLKKIQSSTLVETIIASAIILIIFVIGSLSINNAFVSTLKNDSSLLDARISELEYLTLHDKILLPFYEDTKVWDIVIEKKNDKTIISVVNKKNESEKTIVIADD